MAISDPWKSSEFPIPPVRLGVPIQVYRYVSPGNFFPLPNVVCLGIENREGIDPGQAAFRYVMDERTGGPYTIEQALSTSYTGDLIVEVGDRLCVLATRPDGVSEWIFDGYPMGWGGRIDGQVEGVALQAIGVAKRAFDKPIRGQYMRNADAPETVSDVQTDLPVQFNPRGRPNATPEDADAGDDPKKYPTFLDPLMPRPTPEDPPIQRRWTLPMAVRYLLFRENAAETFVKNPPGADLDTTLVSYEPIDGVAIDPADSSTYVQGEIAAADIPLNGDRWPTAIRKLTEDYGFAMRWDLQTSGGGDPATTLRLFWGQAGPVKSIYLAERGSDFDAAQNNIGAAEFERDISAVTNKVVAEGGLMRYEASFVLQCGFPSDAADAANAAALAAFKEADPAFATSDNFDKYRLYIFDETGEGHYAPDSTTKLTDVPSLATLLTDEHFVKRRRAGIGELFTTDTNGKPLQWRLAISTDYAGTAPGLWDGSGTWQPCEGGAHLLKDRLGIRITIDDPNAWNIGRSMTTSHPFPGGIVKAVKCQADPDAANPKFFLRLTCVIEGDEVGTYDAERQNSSPILWDIEERIDARDRFVTKIKGAQSEFNETDDQQTVVNDSDYLKAEAISVRAAKEAGVFESEIMIPYFTRAYEVGDRIDRIEGRNLGFRTDGGGPGVMPVLPMVVAVRWEFSGGQRTFLTLSDRGANHRQIKRRGTKAWRYNPAPLKRRIKRVGDFEGSMDPGLA